MGKGDGPREPARRNCTDVEYAENFERTFEKRRSEQIIPWGNEGDPDEAYMVWSIIPEAVAARSKSFYYPGTGVVEFVLEGRDAN